MHCCTLRPNSYNYSHKSLRIARMMPPFCKPSTL
uniref:Uncharacterized protein n=1 Tax=Rhizophora mucronata TaxID=61149 RepID=A0A2P2NH76_RHIMU